jgi:hypothetical protein
MWSKCERTERLGWSTGQTACPIDTASRSYAATSTFIWRGLASSRRGSRSVNTPFFYSAATLVGSTVRGSENDRLNVP